MLAPINAQNQTYEKPSSMDTAKGIIAGMAVNSACNMLGPTMIAPKLMERMTKLSDSVTPDEYSKIYKAADDMIKTTGLAEKGVKIVRATKDNISNIWEILNNEIKNNKLAKFRPKAANELEIAKTVALLKEGKNAFYTMSSKAVVIPENKLGLALFHEIGHAMNANLSKIGRLLQKSRPLASLIVLPIISAIALFKTKKAPGEKPQGTFDKITTFIKEHAGKLTFAAFLPTILEEGMATLKGNKFAKKLLNPELAKKVAKTNAYGFASYICVAALAGIGISLGAKAKDAIASNKLRA